MKAFILAGGLATRLGLITQTIPKALVPIGRKPFLYYVLHSLRSQDIREIVLLVGHHADMIVEEFRGGEGLGLKIEYVREYKPLGTGGALLQARRLFEDNDLVLNGDTYCQFDIKKFRQFHLDRKSDFTVGVTVKSRESADYGFISLNSDKKIFSFKEKAVGGSFISAGFYFVSRKFVQSVDINSGSSSLEVDLLPKWTQKSSRIYGYPIEAKNFYDIGTPERLEIFKKYAEKNLC